MKAERNTVMGMTPSLLYTVHGFLAACLCLWLFAVGAQCGLTTTPVAATFITGPSSTVAKLTQSSTPHFGSPLSRRGTIYRHFTLCSGLELLSLLFVSLDIVRPPDIVCRRTYILPVFLLSSSSFFFSSANLRGR